jgi:hypothetical protein
MKIYKFDEFAYYTGDWREITEFDPIPIGWTSAPLPEIPEGHFAILRDRQWYITNHPRPEPLRPPDELPD